MSKHVFVRFELNFRSFLTELMHTFLNINFKTLFLKIDHQNVFINLIILASEVTKQWYSRCICWNFSICFKFDSENAITLLISFPFGVKHHFCHAHHYCYISVSFLALIYSVSYLKCFLRETYIYFQVILVTKTLNF